MFRSRSANRSRVLASMIATVALCLSWPHARAQSVQASSASPLAPDYELHGDGSVTQRVCFNWSCASQQRMHFSASEMQQVAEQMAMCPGHTTYQRVQRLRVGIWQMELLAQKHQPLLANDEPINDRDQDVEGRMDCIDNSTNTSTFISVLVDLGLLPGWSVAEPRVRDRFSMQVHWTAVALDVRSARAFAVDSWFRGNGHLPFVMPVTEWVQKHVAWKPPFDRLNPFPRYSNELCDS